MKAGIFSHKERREHKDENPLPSDGRGQGEGCFSFSLCSLRSLWLKNLLLVFTVFVVCPVHAQIQQAWVARYNNGLPGGAHQAVKMTLDAAGNIYVTGFSQNANHQLGYVIIKYAPNGNQIWASRYDSANYPSATPAAMVLDSSNNVLVTGTALTVKYGPNGNQLWTAPYAGTALATDAAGDAYVAGFGTNFGTVKLSPAGSNLWVTTFTDVGQTVSQSVLVDSGNNVYVSGSDQFMWVPTSEENPNEGYFATELATIKYGPNGNQMWKAVLNVASILSTSVQIGGSALDSGNNVYLVSNWTFGYGFVTSKFGSSGNTAWYVDSGAGNGNNTAHGLGLRASGDLILIGVIYHGSYVGPSIISYGTFDLNANGVGVWTNLYPENLNGTNIGASLAVDSFNNSYVTGYAQGTNASSDIVTIKYGPNGNQTWLQRYHGPGSGNDAGNAIAVDNNGNVYVTGYESTAAGGTEIVTIKYSPLLLQPRADGSVLLQAQGSVGESFEFLGSADLLNWVNLGSAAADTNGLAQFADTNAADYPARFYLTNPQ